MKGEQCKCRQMKNQDKKVCMLVSRVLVSSWELAMSRNLPIADNTRNLNFHNTLFKADVRQRSVEPGRERGRTTANRREERTTG